MEVKNGCPRNRIVTFPILPFSTSMIMEERVVDLLATVYIQGKSQGPLRKCGHHWESSSSSLNAPSYAPYDPEPLVVTGMFCRSIFGPTTGEKKNSEDGLESPIYQLYIYIYIYGMFQLYIYIYI